MTTWIVVHGRGEVDGIPADRYQITTAGALVFEDGDFLDSRLVLAYAPGEWQKVLIYEPDKHGDDHEHFDGGGL